MRYMKIMNEAYSYAQSANDLDTSMSQSAK